MLNVLIVFYAIFFHNFGLAIIIFTILTRLIMLPLTMKQLHATKKLAELQPKLQEIQKQYAKDKDKLAKETTKLYKESGINPLGCLLPMLIQLPIWIALYQSILHAMGSDLSKYLYSWGIVQHAVGPEMKVELGFLWLNLGHPDPYYLLPFIVAGTTWAQQKMVATTATDPTQRTMNTVMLWMMPLMFGFFTLQFPSGLALYWVISNIVSIIMQYFVTGWGGLAHPFGIKLPVGKKEVPPIGGAKPLERVKETSKQEKRLEHGKHRSNRKDSGGSHPESSGPTGTKSGGGGDSSPKKR